MENEYVLYIDDTGFNAHEKFSQTLKNELTTYVGVLIPKEDESKIRYVMDGMASVLNERYGKSEFHFTEIYNRKPPYENISFNETLNLLDAFVELFAEYGLKIIVHTENNENKSEAEKMLKQNLNKVLKMLNLPENEKSQALMLTYFLSKKYVKENNNNAEITSVVCDEGLRKNNAVVNIPANNVNINFKSSNEDNLLQLADFAAWFLTRSKHILDKISKNEKVSKTDEQVLNIFSGLSNNYTNLTKTFVEYDNLKNFNYDKKMKK